MSSLSRQVVNRQGDTLIGYDRVATITQTSITTIHSFVRLGIVEPEGTMLSLEDTLRVMKIMRLRRDLGLNIVGAAMVLELTEENYKLRSQLDALRNS